MGEVHSVCAVATQGKLTGSYVTSYKLYFSIDGVNWMVYTELNKMKVKKKHLTDLRLQKMKQLSTKYKPPAPPVIDTCRKHGRKKESPYWSEREISYSSVSVFYSVTVEKWSSERKSGQDFPFQPVIFLLGCLLNWRFNKILVLLWLSEYSQLLLKKLRLISS